jgi:hypothetical protein
MSDTTIPDTYDDGQTPMDMTVSEVDLDGDGVTDMYHVVDEISGAEALGFDVNGDGALDTMVVDIDGDGTFDGGMMDTDGDGELDTEFDPNSGGTPSASSNEDPPFPVEENDSDAIAPVAEQPDTDSDSIHGEPMAEIAYHQAQAGNNDCLPTSVSMVLSEITGQTVPAADVTALATKMGLLSENGMTLQEGVLLLNEFGVEAEVQTGSLDGLRSMLDNGTQVIIGLDSDDLYGSGDAPFEDNLVMGHAVVITGIDDEAGLVYINDPGFPDGAGIAIPIDQFEDAWTDTGHSLLVVKDSAADAAPETSGVAGTPDSTADDSLVDQVARLALLPFNLSIG